MAKQDKKSNETIGDELEQGTKNDQDAEVNNFELTGDTNASASEEEIAKTEASSEGLIPKHKEHVSVMIIVVKPVNGLIEGKEMKVSGNVANELIKKGVAKLK